MQFQPLTDREKRAIALWATLLAVLGVLDYNQRGASTLSEAHRALRRRIGKWGWRLVWVSFALWFLRHVEED